jgi:cell division protein FtsW
MTCIALGIIIGVTKKEEEIAEDVADKEKRDEALQRLINKQLEEDEVEEQEDFSIQEVGNPMNAVLNKK